MNLTINQYLKARQLKKLYLDKETSSIQLKRNEFCNGVFEWCNVFLQITLGHKRCIQNSMKFFNIYVDTELKKFENEYSEKEG